MILEEVKLYGSIVVWKFWSTLFFLSHRRFHSSSSHCSLSESLFWSSVLRLYPEYLWILRMTSLLLVILADREGGHWVLVNLTFTHGLWSHSIQWEWANVGVTYKRLGVLSIPFISSHWNRGFFVLLHL